MKRDKIGKKEIILAISSAKEFEKFLNMDLQYGVLIDFHISVLQSLVQTAHKHCKKVLLHMDLLHGLSNDEAGCEYACQVLKADGVISTKPKVVQRAMENKCLGVLRLFLIDSKSLAKGIKLCRDCKPDLVEVLPAIAPAILPRIKEETGQRLMSGGLLSAVEEIEACFEYGAEAVTVSNRKLVEEYLRKE
ncbi:MAG: glycerol-3-phosphate responsive antiterminator [Eubacteriales bacterium]|nr:glycerol-3-phosphate responsive antiterminator [Eubacteriales bacterium]